MAQCACSPSRTCPLCFLASDVTAKRTLNSLLNECWREVRRCDDKKRRLSTNSLLPSRPASSSANTNLNDSSAIRSEIVELKKGCRRLSATIAKEEASAFQSWLSDVEAESAESTSRRRSLSSSHALLSTHHDCIDAITRSLTASLRASSLTNHYLTRLRLYKRTGDVLRMHGFTPAMMTDSFTRVCGTLPLPHAAELYCNVPTGVLTSALFFVASAVATVEWVWSGEGGGEEYRLPHPIIVPNVVGGGDFNGYFNDGLARILESRSKHSETYDLGRREGSYREGESEILDDDFKQFEVKKRREREGIALQLLQHNVVDMCLFFGVEVDQIHPPEEMGRNLGELHDLCMRKN